MTNRVLIGDRNGSQGLWVSKPGYDVLSASHDNMLFTMAGRILQIIQYGEFTVSSTTNIPLSNTGGSTPTVLIWHKFQSYYGATGYLNPDYFDVSATSSQLSISVGSGFSGTYTGTYIVFSETL
tara:strand:+ start:503 stop:874 length:372 start_codon:yes stop_codon:yes gene_type:complete